MRCSLSYFLCFRIACGFCPRHGACQQVMNLARRISKEVDRRPRHRDRRNGDAALRRVVEPDRQLLARAASLPPWANLGTPSRDRRPKHALVSRRNGAALSFYGDVPQLIVPETRARSSARRAGKSTSSTNQTVSDFARYSGVSVLPAHPCSPRGKDSAESAVQVQPSKAAAAHVKDHDTALLTGGAAASRRGFQQCQPRSRLTGFRGL